MATKRKISRKGRKRESEIHTQADMPYELEQQLKYYHTITGYKFYGNWQDKEELNEYFETCREYLNELGE